MAVYDIRGATCIYNAVIDCGIKLLGLGILAIGIWAWSEKDTFNNLSKLTNIALDPAFIFIWAGAITFIIG